MTTFINPHLVALVFPAVVLVLFYSCSVWSVGFLLTYPIRKTARLEPIATYVLGHAVLGLLIQSMALLRLIHWYILLPLLSGLILSTVLLKGFPRFRDRIQDFSWQKVIPSNRSAQLLACAVITLILLLAVVTFSVPGTDALAYYMAQPKLIAATGQYTLLPRYENFATLPAIAEMPYTILYCLGLGAIGTVAAKLSTWPVLVAILCLLWVLAKKLGASVNAAWVLIALAATSTAITLVVWDGKTDLIGLMYALTAVMWMPGLLSERLAPQKHLPWLFGFMAACAVMAKVSYLPILPFCLGVPLFLLWRKQPLMFCRIAGVAYLAAMLTFTLGWWAKNYVLFADPFAPFWTFKESTPDFNLSQVWFDAASTRWLLATYPLALTFGNYPIQHGGLSAIWLMLVPALWTKPWHLPTGKKALFLSWGALAGLGIWMGLRPSVMAPRYFLPALMLPCCVLILGFDQWAAKKRAWATSVTIASILVVVLNVYYVVAVYKVTTLPLLGTISGVTGLTPMVDRANKLTTDTRSDLRVLLLSYSSELLSKPILASFILLSTPTQPILSDRVLELKGNETILDFALREKIDYIVYDPITHKRDDLDLPAPSGLKVEKLEYAKDVYYLYALERQDAKN